MTARVVHVIASLFTGGAEMMLYKLLGAMGPERFEHRVVSLSCEPGPMAARIEALGIRVDACGMRFGFPNPAEAFRAARRIAGLSPDLLHGWMYHGNLAAEVAAVLSPRSVPVIWNICDTRARHEKLSTRVVSWLGARLSRRPDCIISDSNASARVHRQLKYCSERWEVIPNGFDTDKFQPSEKARRELRAELSLPDDALLVGLIGRYRTVKNHAGFLEAAALLRRRAPEAQFVLVGDGVAGNRTLLDQASSLGLSGSVHLSGERADMPQIAAALDIAVSASHSESLPSVVGEAMSCGVPCVVTDVGDSSWLVGDTGLVVPPRNPAAFASGCADLVSRGRERRKTLGLAARRRIVEEFSLKRFAGRYERVYGLALDRRGPRSEQAPRFQDAWGGGR